MAEQQTPICQTTLTRGASSCFAAVVGFLVLAGQLTLATAATTQERYYAHAAVRDRDGVIAPWYSGQNGLVDYRVRVAAEFLKRYPWVGRDQSVMAGPHWVFNARVDLNQDGKISVLPATDQMNGNLGQRFKYITEALPRYYRYTGDPVVLGHLKIAADFLLDYYLTPDDHSWPRFPISVPLAGKPYGAAAPGGWIQLDLSAGIGLGLLRVYQMTGESRYLAAAQHIGDVFATKCSLPPGTRPWNRYAEGGESPWGRSGNGNRLTGGVANILIFLDELIRLGYTGHDQAIVRARDAGRVYLRDALLPAWTANDTWGRHYWDWEHPVQGILPTGWVAQYLLDHQDVFPDWKYDVRNILSLYLNRACGDWIVTVRHDGAKSVRVLGDDPQAVVDDDGLTYEAAWEIAADPSDFGGKCHVTENAGATAACRFQGNQVRLIGRVDPSGGLADVYLDGVKQLVGIDCWTPGATKHQQVLYYRNGLSQGSHELMVVARGEKNPYARSARIFVDAVQSSAAAADPDFGAGGGPRHPQRMIFGYSARKPCVDAAGNEWLPGTEFVVRSGHNTDSVTQAWWTQGVTEPIANTQDPELYRYGVHAAEFWINVTVAPGAYRARLKFAERRAETDPRRRAMTVSLNGQPAVQALDVAARAGGLYRAFDLDLAEVRPSHGVIEIRLSAPGGEAMLQALEIIHSEFDERP